LAIGEVRIASLKRVASQGFSSAFEGVLSFVVQSCFSSEAKITSLLAPSGALPLASRQRSLALGALSLASRQRSLAPGAVGESDAKSSMLLAPKSVLALASYDKRD